MKIKSPEIKTLIHDLITYEDGLDANGKRVSRAIFPKDILRGALEARNAIRDNVEILVGNEWKGIKDIKEGDKPLAERHKDIEIELTQPAINAVQYFYSSRNEICGISISALDEFEALLLK